jgi:Tfp pilus assembly protein PilO
MNRNITATILIVLAIGLYMTVTRSQVAVVQGIRAQNLEYTTAISNAERLIKVRDRVLKDYNNIREEDRQRLDKMIPNTVDNIRLIIDMNSIGLKHGFSLRNIKANASKGEKTNVAVSSPAQRSTTRSSNSSSIPTPTLDTVSVSFSVTATYQQFINFMRDLESNLRIMDLTKLTLTANDNGMYDFGVELRTYWLRQQ